MKKIVIGLSGGVDSALAASILKAKGFEVTGVFLKTSEAADTEAACAAAKDAGIELKIIDVAEKMENLVCRPFRESYLNGKTPSPCVLCNSVMKFPQLLSVADAVGAEKIATGHYAGIEKRGERYCLLKGRSENDQSYMLSRLDQLTLSRTIFPLEDRKKSETRAQSREKSMSAADKPDSMEICFIPDNDHIAFMEKFGVQPPEGSFIDTEGNIIGKHSGIHRYTVGQRKGLGAFGRPVFVSAIDPVANTVTLAGAEEMLSFDFKVSDLNPVAWAEIKEGAKGSVRVRHSRVEYPAVMHPEGNGQVRIECPEGVRAPTPGQAAVVYDGNAVAFSGWID